MLSIDPYTFTKAHLSKFTGITYLTYKKKKRI